MINRKLKNLEQLKCGKNLHLALSKILYRKIKKLKVIIHKV